jgi:type I restriction enzyme S subunit
LPRAARFFELLFRTSIYLTEIDRYSHGIVRDRNRLYWDGFKQMNSALPPSRAEQKKQRLIELLDEKRAALISHAVTKGLDPEVAMRPSGVEWIGDVPAHWEVKKLGVLPANMSSGWLSAGAGSLDVRRTEHLGIERRRMATRGGVERSLFRR